MTPSAVIALDRDNVVGPTPTWETLPEEERRLWLAEIENFPTPPFLLELMSKDLHIDYYNPASLAAKLSRDSVLTGVLLARANSAALAPRQPVTSLRMAIVHLGFNLVRSLIVHYQVERSAEQLKGIVKEHILRIQKSTDRGAVIAFNWSSSLKLKDPAAVATQCLLGRLGSFLMARRYPDRMDDYFSTGHEPQRLNFEANNFGLTSRNLTYKIAQWWGLPEPMQLALFNLWTPLFAEFPDASTCVASAAMSLSFDPPHHTDDIHKWLSKRVHFRLRQNLEAVGALKQLPNVLESDAYQREMAAVEEIGN